MTREELAVVYTFFISKIDPTRFKKWLDHDEGEASLVLLKLPPGSKEILDGFPSVLCSECSKKEGCEKSETLANDFLSELIKEGLTIHAVENLSTMLANTKGETHARIKGVLGEAKRECSKGDEEDMA